VARRALLEHGRRLDSCFPLPNRLTLRLGALVAFGIGALATLQAAL